MPLEISALSRQYVKVPVAVRLAGAAVNPTTDTVQIAFPPVGTAPQTWINAAWEIDSSASSPVYLARCTVGPGGAVTLTPGPYDIYVKVTDSPEIPVVRSPVYLHVF